MTKIDILVANNSYSSAASFSRAIFKAFQRAHVQTRIFFVGQGDFYKAFYQIINSPPDFTFSFSNVTINGKSLASKWLLPHFSFLLDPSIYYLHQLEGKNSFLSCVDRKDIVMMQKLKKLNKTPFFLPHGIDYELFKKNPLEKTYDIVMVGTCNDYEKIRQSWQKQFSPEVAKLLDIAQEIVLSSSGLSCFEALWQLCGDRPEMHEHLTLLHRELDLFITSKERINLLKALKNHSIHIFGKGPWKKYFPHANVHPQVPFTKTLKIFAQSKIVLNSSPRFKDGSHERPFASFALGALPLTGKNPFFCENYEDETSILFYNYGDYKGVSDIISYYLNHDKKRNEVIEKGREITLKNHTWDSRVDSLLRLVNIQPLA